MTEETVTTTKIPLFRGNSKDTLSVRAWTDQVDRAQTQQGWTADTTAAAAINAMRESASVWVENLQDSSPDDVTDWERLKKQMLKRFAPHTTAAQQVRTVASLTQKQGESVVDFFDRVEAAVRLINKDQYDRIAGGAGAADKKEGFRMVRNNMQRLHFVAGLRTEIRRHVESGMKEDDELDTLRNAAVRAEAAEGLIQRGSGPQIAGLDTNGDAGATGGSQPDVASGQSSAGDIMKEIAAIKATLRSAAPGAKRNGGGGAAKGNKVARPPMRERNWTLCFRCRQWGQHLRDECKLTQQEIDSLTPQARNARPTGQPFDSQFPNA